MTHGWIIDVLSDLRTFAQMNGLPLLAAELDSAAQIAKAEIALVKDEALITIAPDVMGSGDVSGAGREGRRA